MTRLIDADAISWELVDVGYIPVITKEEIDAMPTVDAEPVKHGVWIDNECEKYTCSECGRTMWFLKKLSISPNSYKYCPNCGAKMDAEMEDVYVTLHHDDINFKDEESEKAFYSALERKEE